MAQSDHIVEIIIQTNDQTGGALGKVQNSLLALDRAVQKTQERMKRAFSSAYSATIRLIDNVTPAGSRINDLLKRLAGKTYNLALRLTDGATNGIRNLEAKLMRLAGKTYTVAVNLKDNASKKLSGLADGALLGMGGMGATMLGTAGIGYGVVNAFQSQMAFEKQMSAVKAIMSGSTSSVEELDAQMAQLTKRAEEMGATTKFTAKESADALFFMGMAGWTTEQQIAGLPSVLNLAAAGNTDLATTSDIVTDTLTAFGLKAGDAFKYDGKLIESSKHYTDMMAALVTNANTDISKLGQTLKYAAPVIQAMYANGTAEEKMHGAEDAMLITGLMANAGIKDTQAGTSLKSMLARLSGDQRNAYFAQNALGVDFVDQQTGEIRRLKDIVGDFRKAFKEGVDMDRVTDFFEQISGEKIHADTRRKLEGYFETAQKNGGKLTGKEMMKMTNLLSGLEAMPGWISAFLSSEEDWNKIESAMQNCEGAAERMAQIQLDNLAGDITILGSAWDAFQRNLVKGGASESLRGFVQTLTDVITKANKLFSDGIQIGDFGAMIADIVTRLKNKFLEFDGIGSILAGGALMAGLLKITKTATNLYSKIKSLKSLSIGAGIIPPTPTPTPTGIGGIGSSQQVTSMVVHANSVVVNGRTIGNSGNIGRRVGNQAYVDNYYKRRETILAGQNAGGRPPTTSPVPPLTPNSSGIGGFARNGLRVAGGASILAGIFGAMDIYSARSHSQETLAEANQTVAYHRQVLEDLKNQNAGQDEINRQVAEVRAAEDFQQRTVKMNNQVERQAEYGAFGAVSGTALGAAVGSVVPVIGTTIGGIIGGILGDYLGTKAADVVNQAENNAQQNSGEARSIYDVVRGKPDTEQVQRDHEYSQKIYGEIVSNRLDIPLDIQPTTQPEGENSEYQFQMDLVPHTTPAELYEGNAFTKIVHNKELSTEDWNQLYALSDNATTATNAVYVDEETAAARQQALIDRGAELAKIRDDNKRDGLNLFNGGRSNLLGTAPSWDYGLNLSKEDYESLAAYDEDRQNKAIQEIHARHASEQATQDAQTADFLKQQGKSYSEIQGNTVKSEKGSDEWIVNTNPYDVAKKNLDEQAAASHKQIDAQNELTQKIRDLNQQAQKAGENKDFFKDFSIGDFLDDLLFNKAAAQRLHEEEGIEGIDTPEVSAPTYPQLENPQFKEKSFEVSDMLPDFDFSDLLPDFDLSNIFGEIDIGEKFQSLLEGIGEIDIASLLPDFSSISEMIGEQLNFIPEKVSEITTSIGEGFSQIPTAASEAFNIISTYANEGLTTIQTAWNELPSFFGGLFDGLGGVATSSGAAIAAGLNSAIGTIQSAWDGLSSWLSAKISSLSAMASNAVNSIMSIGGGGSVSPKAEGGFISSPQQILAGEAGLEVIIPLATSRRKRALDLLKKTAAIVGGDSVNITGDQFKPEEHLPVSENISTLEKAKNRRVEQVMRQVENVRQNSEEPLLATQSIEKNTFPELSATDKQLADAVKLSESGVAPKFDELGNLKDYSGLADNVITADDDLFVQHAKQEQQLKEFWANNSELGEGLSVEDGAVTSGGGDVDNSIGGIELGGIQAHFELNGSESPQEVMQTIRENLGDLADQIGGKIAEKISEIRMNMPLMA